LQGFNPMQPDYWLAYWLGIYQNLWETFTVLLPDQCDRILWMSHERMCKAPAQELNRLFSFVNIDHATEAYTGMLRQVKDIDLTDHFDTDLTQRARALHRDILQHSKP
jgi:hypothetical protein